MRRISFSSFLVFLLLGVSSHIAMAAEDMATGGISTAMSPDEVKAKLGPEWVLAQTANIERGKAFNFTRGHEGFSLLTLGPRIVYIEHQQIFDTDKPIVITQLTKALKEKYGQPTLGGETPDDLTETWLIDKNGNLLDPSHAREAKACASYEIKGPFFSTSEAKVPFDFGFPAIPLKDGLQNCGTVIIAKPSRGSNKGLSNQLTVSIFDMKAANDWFKKAMEEFNQYEQNEVDAAMKNKPNL